MKMKLSEEKATFPGPKQVWRLTGADGSYREDLIALADEQAPPIAGTGGGQWRPLLELVMKGGQNISEACSTDKPASDDAGSEEIRQSRLNSARVRAAEELKRLPGELLLLDSEARYPVKVSERLSKQKEALEKEITSKHTQ
jgi:hypothetical protein